jgi:two-component system response regulator FlrC
VDFRVIATTNRNLEQEVRDGKFRSDLYFRLNVIPIKVPPLRSRRDDILSLATHFISKVAGREGMPEKGLSPQAKDALLSYSWPGNVRELENVMERSMILTDGPEITLDSVELGMQDGHEPAGGQAAVGTTIHEMEKNLICSTLQSVDGNRTRAASLLGISIRTLRNKLNEYSGKGQISDR